MMQFFANTGLGGFYKEATWICAGPGPPSVCERLPRGAPERGHEQCATYEGQIDHRFRTNMAQNMIHFSISLLMLLAYCCLEVGDWITYY